MTDNGVTWHAQALVWLVAATFFMENLDATVLTPALPQMAEAFGVAPIDLNSGVSAYMLTLGVFIPVSGWIAERFGTRRVLAVAIAVFTLASLLCGRATSLPEFVLMRVLQGIGGALMVPVGRLAVLRTTPKHRLITAIAMLTWPALVAPVLGPPVGGLIVDHAHWRWIFYLNVPLGLVALVLAWWLVAQPAVLARRPFDWPGFVLTGVALVSLLFATQALTATHIQWLPVALSGVLGLVLLVAGVRHLRRTATPMLRFDALAIPTFAVTVWGGSLFRMGVSAVPFLLPLMFQIGFGYSAFQAGLLLMVVFAGNLLMKPMTTPVLRRFGFRPVLVVNGALNALSIAACALFSADTALWLVGAVLFVGGMTRSMQFTALNTIAFADVPAPQMADANTLFSTAFQLAMGLGIALGAMAWHVAGAVATEASPAMPFRAAFVLVALVAAFGIGDSLTLSPQAGAHVAGRQPAGTD